MIQARIRSVLPRLTRLTRLPRLVRLTRLTRLPRPPRLPWPLPAVLAWGAGWACWQLGLAAGLPAGLAWLSGLVLGAALGMACAGRWRRWLAIAGFPFASLALGALPGWPAWAWLLLSSVLLLLYPLGAWRDAPFFPTASDALRGLNQTPGLAAPQRVLDAGSGLGHGLLALRGEWPQARFIGLERSLALRSLCAWRCRWAELQGGDMWRASWAGNDLVYMFQRPESMPRAWAKAQQELQPGSWLVSLEFAVPGVAPDASLQGPGRRPVWAYRIGRVPTGVGADVPTDVLTDVPPDAPPALRNESSKPGHGRR